MRYILCETASKQKYNAAKARADVKTIAVDAGYKFIPLFHNGYFKPYIVCEMIFGCVKAICKTDKEDVLLIQYPYYPDWINRFFLNLLRVGKRIKKYQVVMLIHDVPALRHMVGRPAAAQKLLAREIQSWSWVDRVICHNEKMLAALKRTHPYDRYSVLGVFDYLYDGAVCERVYRESPIVMVAGNLAREKCGYIYQLETVENVHFDLFGPNYSGEETERVRYRGKYSSDELIPHLDGQFGLVWDGDSIDTCGGDSGEYLKYNNPHKFSLYLAANVPVIVWERSALADYVKKEGLGICIKTLLELPEILENISERCYREICQNVANVRTDIVMGYHLKEVIKCKR